MSDTFQIRYSHGRIEWYETYEEALAAIRVIYTDPVIGHDGDISHGGESTLVWRTEEDAQDDSGLRACCKVYRLRSER